MIILGIDPGFAITGFGVIKVDKNKNEVLDFGTIQTKAGVDFSRRIKDLYNELHKIIKKYKPDLMAVEQLFFAKNAKTALLVGQARGVVLLTAIQEKMPLHEYTPLQVKQAITGYGAADKKQMQQMVKVILGLSQIPKPDDAADALAVAVCCAHSLKTEKIYK